MAELSVEQKAPIEVAASTLVARQFNPAGTWWHDLAYKLSLGVVDCVALLLAFAIAFFLRASLLPEFGFQLAQVAPLEPYLETPWLILLWPAVFYYEGLYERGLGTWDEQVRIPKGIFFGGLLAMGTTFVSRTGLDYSRAIVIGTCLVAFLTVPTLRIYFRCRFLAPSFPIPILLFAGKGQHQQTQGHTDLLRKLGYNTLKIIPVESHQDEADLRSEVHAATAELGPDEILLNQEGLDEETFRKLLRCVESTGRRVGVLSPFSVFQLRASIRNLDGLILFDLNSGLARPLSRLLKRAMDFISALLFLFLFAPIFLIIGILIKLDSPGPVFFSHRRLDYRERAFGCLKFRTMYRDADERLKHWMEQGDPRAKEFQVAFKLKDDPRITRVGKWLRKTSLDELLQLINVLKGDMSLVGPRPIVPEEVQKYGRDFQYLLMAKGGMTGIWQVSGRNDLDYAERIALDTYYVRNWSVWTDIVILLKTLGVVLTKSGAY